MAKLKLKSQYVCQSCGAQRPKWEGRCSDCGSWNSLVEEKSLPDQSRGQNRGWTIGKKTSGNHTIETFNLNETVKESSQPVRHHTAYKELDRVLGGGIVPGSFVLLGGDPGVGKSTLLLQMAAGIAQLNDLNVFYLSAEESPAQTTLRAQRLGLYSKNVTIASESQLEIILDFIKTKAPHLVIIDSIQTVYLSDLNTAPGSVSQVRECAAALMALAKSENICVFIIGHVTKDGQIAGPRALEHMVDAVLSFEGNLGHPFRILRSLKNRFGATQEMGVFRMNSEGLKEVSNPSEFFLEERSHAQIGASVLATMEGTRPVLCEVQALTTVTYMSMPRRTAIGFDNHRVHLLCAVLDKKLNTDFHRQDVFINVVGGLKLQEPAADLAVALSLLSSKKQKALPPHTLCFGEVGLTGEVRPVSFPELRLKEGEKLGFKNFILPEANRKHLKNFKFSGQCQWIKTLKDLNDCF